MLQDSTNRLRINVTLFEFLRKDGFLLILSIAVSISDFNVTCCFYNPLPHILLESYAP